MQNPRTSASLQALVIAVLILFVGNCALAKKALPERPIDINAATAKELEELPGVGPTTANAIVLFRTRSGRFHRVEDLLSIRGISEPKLKRMRPYITLGLPAQPVKVAGGAPKTAPQPQTAKPTANSGPSNPVPGSQWAFRISCSTASCPPLLHRSVRHCPYRCARASQPAIDSRTTRPVVPDHTPAAV